MNRVISRSFLKEAGIQWTPNEVYVTRMKCGG